MDAIKYTIYTIVISPRNRNAIIYGLKVICQGRNTKEEVLGSEGKCVVVLKKQQLSNEEPKTPPETYLAVSSECQLYIDVDHLNEPESILSIY